MSDYKTPVTEDELKARTTGRRVTEADVMENIEKVDFYVHPDSCLTICIITTWSGYTVTGESACADPANFKQDVGERYAFEKAKNALWGPMGYHLKQTMYEEKALLDARVVTGEIGTDNGVFIGTKVVNAKPMNRADYDVLRGWELPTNENGADEGYLVEYTDKVQENCPGYLGYVSWSPKDVFERAYRRVI